ncbi:hypothetical protein BDZ85DRAFT_127823 [Elsinoe ampelina]|uniref:Uncharacterized protein n=1 Tax=Elsinoe ampelina TaxID=302913 RepID=A0A6A6G9P2_9PEZI|nr:hypothetical protein BDZ85DRAFT_127823 [Elsinoe ampelina]
MRPSTLGIHCLLAVLAYGAAIDTSKTAAGLIARDQRYAEAEYGALNRRNEFPASDPLDGMSTEPLVAAHDLAKRAPKKPKVDTSPVDTKTGKPGEATPPNSAGAPPAPTDKNAPANALKDTPPASPVDKQQPGGNQPNGLPNGPPPPGQQFGQDRELPGQGMMPQQEFNPNAGMKTNAALGIVGSTAPVAAMGATEFMNAENAHQNQMEYGQATGMIPPTGGVPPTQMPGGTGIPTSPTSSTGSTQTGAGGQQY